MTQTADRANISDVEVDVGPEEDAIVGRAAVRGAVIGYVSCVILVALLGRSCGLSGASSIGLGLFVGMWGGLGFGFMFGASVAGMHLLDAHDVPTSAG